MHGRKFLIIGLVLLAVGLWAPAGQADLITNGSFENTNNTFVPDSNDTMSLPVSSTAIPGWEVTTGSIAWIGPTNTFGLTASKGDFFLDLTDYRDAVPYGGVAQTNINTVPGQKYLLGFDLGSSTTYGIPGAITVSATAGPTSQTFTSTNTSSSNAWEHFTMEFTATGLTTTISLTGSVAGQNNAGKYIGLDNVTVSSVPIPPSALLLGSGLVALGLLARRRRQSRG